jgi:alpha-1,6-mannosyltransferase
MNQLAEGYREYGHRVMLVVPGKRFTTEAMRYGYLVTIPSPKIPFSGGYRIMVNVGKVRRILAGFAPHVIEVSDRSTLIPLGKWARRRGVVATAFSHETLDGLTSRFLPFRSLMKKLVRKWNRHLSHSFDHVVATTKFAAREFEEIHAINLRLVPLGVDLIQFSPNRFDPDVREKLAQGAQILLVHCGRLSAEKSPEKSIETLQALLEKGHDARLLIVGDGPLRDRLENSSRNLPVSFMGFVSDRDLLASLLATADVALAPGPHETFCLAALEALASGTPVVASASSAVREVIGVENGRAKAGAVAFDSAESFSEAVERIFEIPEATRRTESRRRAERFPWWLTVERMLGLYRDPTRSARAG